MSAPIPQQTMTIADVRAAYEAWRDAPRNDRYAEAVAYQTAARSQNRAGQVCTCGVVWGLHFPVGVAGCDHFETREDEEAAEAASNLSDRIAAIPRTDPIQEVRDRIRTAMRELVPVQRRLQAEGDTTPANDVEFAISELALALDALREVVTR